MKRRHRCAIVAFGLATVLAPGLSVPAEAASAPASLQPPEGISNTPGQPSTYAAIAMDAGTIYVAWREQTTVGQDIRLRRSITGGTTFLDGPSGVVLAQVEPGDTVHSVRIAARGAAVHVLYTAGLTPELAQVNYSRSTDGGATFSAPILLAGGPGGSAFADVTVDGRDNVHVVMEDRGGSDDIQEHEHVRETFTQAHLPLAGGDGPCHVRRPSPDRAGNPVGATVRHIRTS